MSAPGGVTSTALWTAAARAVESEREDRLFDDPWARALAGADGFAIMERFERFTGGRNPVLPLRTRFYDGIVTDAVGRGVTQVVLLAAGLDTRAFRLGLPGTVTVFELDDAALLAEKDARLAELGARPTGPRRSVPGELGGDWTAALRDAGLDPARETVWIAEGVLPYLDQDLVERLLATAATAAAPGSRLAADTIGATFLSSERMAGQREALEDIDAPWRSGIDDPAAVLRGAGWEPVRVLQPGEPGADFRPLPYPVVPMEVHAPDVPRVLFFEAATPATA